MIPKLMAWNGERMREVIGYLSFDEKMQTTTVYKKRVLPEERWAVFMKEKNGRACYQYAGELKFLKFTGLKDKKHRKVIEDDLVIDEDGEWIAKIVWNEDWASFMPDVVWRKNPDCVYDIRMGRPERFIVIGNIWNVEELDRKLDKKPYEKDINDILELHACKEKAALNSRIERTRKMIS